MSIPLLTTKLNRPPLRPNYVPRPHLVQSLAEGLRQIEGFSVQYQESQTNMVFVTPPQDKVAGLPAYLAEHGILILGGSRVRPIRLVTHLGISEADINTVVERVKGYCS